MQEKGRVTVPVNEHLVTGRQLAFGTLVIGGVNLTKTIIQLVLLPVMARLLDPTEFGLYALAMPTVMFAAMLADGGLGASLAREPETSTIVWSTAFWLLLTVGIGLAAGASVWGVALSAITRQPRLAGLIAWMSIALVLTTMTACAGARLTRRGRLAAGALGDLAATVVGAIVAVVLARRGAGAISLAAQYIATTGIRAIWINALAFQLPTLQFKIGVLRSHLATGGLIVGVKLVDVMERLAGNALFGRMLGVGELGYFTFSTQISRFSTETVSNPVWSALYVKAIQGHKPQTLELYARLIRLMGLLLLPGTFIIAAAAPRLINAFMGAAWIESGVIIRIIIASYAILAISSQVGPILIAYNSNYIFFRTSILLSTLRVASIFLGIWFGAAGVALGVAAANILYSGLLVTVSWRVLGVRARAVLGGLAVPLLSGVAGVAVFMLSAPYFGEPVTATIEAMLLAAVCSMVVTLASDYRRVSVDIMMLVRLVGGPRSKGA